MKYVAVNRTRQEYVWSDDFPVIWKHIVQARRWQATHGQLMDAWEAGKGIVREGRLPAIVGAPIAAFVGGRANVAIIYQRGVTRIFSL